MSALRRRADEVRERPLARAGGQALRLLSARTLSPIEDATGRAGQLLTNMLAVLREGWALGSIGVAANLSFTYLILLAALRFVGVSGGELSSADAFAAFAIAFWAGAVFPITGSGLGVVDAVLTAGSSSRAAPPATRWWPQRCWSAAGRSDGSRRILTGLRE